MNIKQQIINCFDSEVLDTFSISTENISTPPNAEMGDFCLPFFSYLKQLKKSPAEVGNMLLKSFDYNGIVEKTNIIGGYLNFFLNKNYVSLGLIEEILSKKTRFASSNFGEGKTVCVEFSSVNLAKYMHIGHLSTTVIGNCLRNIYAHLGYNTIAINYVGDYGTPFGKMVTAYQLWGDEEKLEKYGVNHIQDLYIKFCQEAENNPELDDLARVCFLKIEQKDKTVYDIYKKFIEISIEETKRIYNILNITFDSWRGESY